MRLGGFVESTTRVEAKLRQIFDTGRRSKLAILHLSRCRTLSEKYLKKGLELLLKSTEMYRILILASGREA